MDDLHDDKSLDTLFEQPSQLQVDHSSQAKNLVKHIVEARSSLLLDVPFFGYILTRFRITPVLAGEIDKFALDSNHLYFRTTYIDSLVAQPEWKKIIKSHLIHLLFHVIYQHTFRKQKRIARIWGVAADIVVYQAMMGNEGQWSAPADWSIPSLKDLPEILLNLPTEQVYDILLESSNSDNQENHGGSNDDLDKTEPKPNLENQQSQEKLESFVSDVSSSKNSLPPDSQWNRFSMFSCNLEEIVEKQNLLSTPQMEMQETQQSLLQGVIRHAYETTKYQGKLPGKLSVVIEKLLRSDLNWRVILINFIQNVLPFDVTWSHPNKRLIGGGYYLPSLAKENLRVLIAVDTSGSIDKTLLRTYLSEIQTILQTSNNVSIRVIDCDTQIQQVTDYESGESVLHHVFKGQGGTDFRPVFQYISTVEGELLIYFTDGHGEYPKNYSSNLPIIWLMSSDAQPPFGEVIYLNLDDNYN